MRSTPIGLLGGKEMGQGIGALGDSSSGETVIGRQSPDRRHVSAPDGETFFGYGRKMIFPGTGAKIRFP
jgi:hypothetical protein